MVPRLFTGLAAAVLLLVPSISIAESGAINLPIGRAELQGTTIARSIPGYTGQGYATGFITAADNVTFRFDAQAGLYRPEIRYSSPAGPKGYNLKVNQLTFSGTFPATGNSWAMHRAGIVRLINGNNIISIGGGWGYYNVNSVRLVPVKPFPSPHKPPLKLSDPNADAAARMLFKKLWIIYGKQTASGCYSGKDAAFIHSQTGRLPFIRGEDFMDYSPSRIAHHANPAGTVQRMIATARNGYILTISWHWNAPMHLINGTYKNSAGKLIHAPWWSGFYTYATTYNLADALAHPKSPEYRTLISNLDAIAIQLKKLQTAGIPVLWRPLHEAEGGWFWWGAHGPEAFKKLWKLMYNRYTKIDHLHNLIWVYTSGGNMAWYPGDKYVDIVGVDAYPASQSDPLTGLYQKMQTLFDGRKLLAITEIGGVPDITLMHSFGEYWDYFVSWNGTSEKATTSQMRKTYNSSLVVDHQ